MRVKVDYRTASRTNYKDFCKEYPEIKLSYDEWKLVIYTFNESMREYILETGEKVRFPEGLGDFSIKKRKCTKTKIIDGKQVITLPVDWKKTKEQGKKIYNFNFHTEGFYFGWLWFKRSVMFMHPDLWYFKPSRTTSRLLNHYLTVDKDYQHKYCEWF